MEYNEYQHQHQLPPHPTPPTKSKTLNTDFMIVLQTHLQRSRKSITSMWQKFYINIDIP